jgi:acid phosphatase type 7
MQQLDDLLVDNHVDLFLAGHYHAYLRTCDGLYNSKCHNGGPMHITIGSAGALLDDTFLYPNGWTDKFIKQEFGYGRITVVNASAMLFEFVKAGDTNDTDAGEVHDDVWILRDR